jgi:hypothetical protein
MTQKKKNGLSPTLLVWPFGVRYLGVSDSRGGGFRYASPVKISFPKTYAKMLNIGRTFEILQNLHNILNAINLKESFI